MTMTVDEAFAKDGYRIEGADGRCRIFTGDVELAEFDGPPERLRAQLVGATLLSLLSDLRWRRDSLLRPLTEGLGQRGRPAHGVDRLVILGAWGRYRLVLLFSRGLQRARLGTLDCRISNPQEGRLLLRERPFFCNDVRLVRPPRNREEMRSWFWAERNPKFAFPLPSGPDDPRLMAVLKPAAVFEGAADELETRLRAHPDHSTDATVIMKIRFPLRPGGDFNLWLTAGNTGEHKGVQKDMGLASTFIALARTVIARHGAYGATTIAKSTTWAWTSDNIFQRVEIRRTVGPLSAQERAAARRAVARMDAVE
jgi:hypothetical protein